MKKEEIKEYKDRIDIEAIIKRRMEILIDERLSYETATIFSNAPLALIQCSLTAELHALEFALGLPKTKIAFLQEEYKKNKKG